MMQEQILQLWQSQLQVEHEPPHMKQSQAPQAHGHRQLEQ